MKPLFVFIIGMILVVSDLFAESSDTLEVKLGTMYVSNFETDLQLGTKGVPIGAKINTKDQLGMKSETAVFRLDGYYRFNDVHSIGFAYYAVNSDSNRFITNDIEWDGDVITDAQVESFFDMRIYKIDYNYSFYHNPDIELALSAGLHIMDISTGLQAKGIVNGIPDQTSVKGGSVTAPLPVLGFRGTYVIVPRRLFVTFKGEYFYLEFDEYKGAFVSNLLDLEYRFMDHVGAGIGFNSNTLILQRTQGDTVLDVTNNVNGVLLYLSFNF